MKKVIKTRDDVIKALKGGRMATIRFIGGDGTIQKVNGQFGNRSLNHAISSFLPNTITIAEFGAGSGGKKSQVVPVNWIMSIRANGQEYEGPRHTLTLKRNRRV